MPRDGGAWLSHLPLTLRPGLGGEGRRAGDAAAVGQDAEDGGLERRQDEQDLRPPTPQW